MQNQAKQWGVSDKHASAARYPRELYRELCQDEDGTPYTVLVFRTFKDLRITHYTHEDGSPVRFVDNCLFEIESTGRTLTRCT